MKTTNTKQGTETMANAGYRVWAAGSLLNVGLGGEVRTLAAAKRAARRFISRSGRMDASAALYRINNLTRAEIVDHGGEWFTDY